MDLRTESQETLAWQEERNARAEGFLAHLPCREALRQSITTKLTETRLGPLRRRGDRWFQQAVLEPLAEQPVLVVRDTPSGTSRVLLDPNELSANRGVQVTLAAATPSPDGRVVACAVMEAGTERNELVLVDVQTGETLPDEVPWNVGPLTWLPDSSGFYCSVREVVDGAVEAPVHLYVLGEQPGPPLSGPAGLADVRPLVSPDGRYVALASGNTEQRLDWWVVDGEVRPFLPDVDGGVTGVFWGEDLLAILDGGAPRGRLVRIPLATASDPSTWVELVAESDDVLRWVEVIADVVVLGYLRDAAARVRLLDLDGRLLEELPLPAAGTVSAYAYGASHPALPMFTAGDDEISFVHSSFESAWGVYRYVLSERRLEVVTPPAVSLEGLVVTTFTAISSDGTPLPTHLVHRADLDTSVPQPTLLHGYGGFNLSVLPSFDPAHAAWVEAGGVFVLAHLRGGSELGADWWHQGRRQHKQQTYDDLYAVAEHLLSTGVTTREKLALKGESNGGLLAGAAVAQRPDLWAAVVCDVPILDLLGYHQDPLTYVVGRVEYGDPLDPVEASWLRTVSPVHNVRPAQLPAVLVTAGANDPRCPTWHSRVFVDLLERNNTGDEPVLLRVYSDQGHGASGLTETAGKSADWLAFVAEATGHTPVVVQSPGEETAVGRLSVNDVW